MHRIENFLAIGVLTLVLLLACVLMHEGSMESDSIRPVIQSMVAEEFRARYRALPIIKNAKYVTILNNGKEIWVEE